MSRGIDPASLMGHASGTRPAASILGPLRFGPPVERARGAASDTGRVGAAAGLVMRTELVKSLALLAAVRAPRLHLTPALTVSALHGVPPLGKSRTPLGRWAAHLSFKGNASVRSLAVWRKSAARGRQRDENAGPGPEPAHIDRDVAGAEPRPAQRDPVAALRTGGGPRSSSGDSPGRSRHPVAATPSRRMRPWRTVATRPERRLDR
jgi:hypothetical protein